MMLKALRSLIKSFKKQDIVEELTSPEQLSKGDMLRFADSFAMPEGLRGETFQVQQVATYFYGDTESPQFVIKSGNRTPLYLSMQDFDGEELIVISRKLKNKDVESLFGWNQLRAAMKDKNSPKMTTHKTVSDNPNSYDSQLTGWIANSYSQKVFGAKGRYFEKDVRHTHGTHSPSGGESFTYFEYYTPDEGKSMEIEVWEGDEIEVCLGLVRPMTDISELWKKS